MKDFYLFFIFVVFLFAYILRTTYDLRLVSNVKNNINEDNEIEVHYYRNLKNFQCNDVEGKLSIFQENPGIYLSAAGCVRFLNRDKGSRIGTR